MVGIGRDVVGRRKDSSTFPLHLAVSELKVKGKSLFTGIIRDLSDQHVLEKEILEVAANEQRRIGQDLHDGTGQELTGLAMMAERLAGELDARQLPQSKTAAKARFLPRISTEAFESRPTRR